jgi:protein TonB
MRIDRYVHDDRLTWGAAGVLCLVTATHLGGIGALLVTRPSAESAGQLPPVFQVSLERLPPLRLPPALEPESQAADTKPVTDQSPPRKTRPVPIIVDTPTTNPVPPDTQVKQYEMGDELLEGDPGPRSPAGAVVGGTGEGPASAPEPPVIWNLKAVRIKPPEYPPHCLRRGIEGVVKVRALIGEDGFVQETTISRSSGDSMLDRAALEAVKDWEFTPPTRGGVPIRAWVVVPIAFKLMR